MKQFIISLIYFSNFSALMQIKYLTKNHTVELKDLESETIGGLRKKIKETIKECADLPDEKVLLFHNKTKVSASEDSKLEESKITNESTVFVVLIKSEQAAQPAAQSSSKSASRTNASAQPSPAQGSFNGFPQGGMPYGMDGSGIEQQLLDQMLKDPDAMLSMLESQMPSLTEDQKAMLKQNIELMKKNPEMIKQMLNNPAVMNAIRNPAMGPPMMNNPYMGNNPYGGGSPMMGGSPYMGGSPMMGSPYMGGNPMMGGNPYQPMNYYNPYMMQQQMNMQAPPPNGPCCHGFYPLKQVNGKSEPQDAESLYADKLTALNEMGFYDKDSNIKALTEAHGDISEAIDILSKKLSNSK